MEEEESDGGSWGGGGGNEPPVLSCQCFLCRWGRRSAKSLSLPLTQTPMHRFIMDALHWCQRKTKAEIGRHVEKMKESKRERCGGAWKKNETAMKIREEEKMPERSLDMSVAGVERQTDGQHPPSSH